MKICAVTMVYRDYWALAQWYRHYARQLGGTNLYVVAHGHDPKVPDICPLANVLTIPRDTLQGFDRKRGRFLNALQAALLLTFDHVIRTDADELICLDPTRFDSFETFFAQQSGPAVFALGLELTEMPTDTPLLDADVALKHRSNAMFTGHYSKAWAVSEPVQLMRHGVETEPRKNRWFEFNMPRGAYLVHLKHANKAAASLVNQTRKRVAGGPESGLPGTAWRDADGNSEKHYAKFEALPLVSWDDAEGNAYAQLHDNPKRDQEARLVRSRSLLFNERTVLPDWFKTL